MKKKALVKRVVAVSGGFDPIHMGHMRMLKEAKKLGGTLVVILNNDNWLKAKKGFVFMPEKERKEMLLATGVVDRVVVTAHKPKDKNRSVSRELAKIKPDVFANGGDRDEKDASNPKSSLYKDMQACSENGIEIVFNVGKGGKVQSSSWLTNKIAGRGIADKRPWGHEEIFKQEKNFWIKTLTVNAGHRFSLQTHEKRVETWVCVVGEMTAEINGKKIALTPGKIVTVPLHGTHRLSSKKGGTVVEVAYGPDVNEKDIKRLADDYGRI